MARGSDSRRPDQSSRRSSREPSSSGGGSRRQGDRSEAPSAPPPFASIAPSGHAMPQPGEEDEGTRAPTYRSTADRESRTAASTSRSSASNPPDYSTQAPRGARAARATSLSTLREESGTLASTRGGQTTRPAGGTRTDGPRGTTVAPRRYPTPIYSLPLERETDFHAGVAELTSTTMACSLLGRKSRAL